MKKLDSGTRLVIGKNSVLELLKWAPERLVTLVSTKDPGLGFPWKKIDYDALSELAHSDSHQGLAAIVREPTKIVLKDALKDLSAASHARVIVLSAVQDPHHLGAIFRAAEAFGADLVVWSHQNSTSITPAVTKVAVGATELVPYCEVSNINEALRKLKDNGFWIVAAEPGSDQKDLQNFDFPNHIALVLGAEGAGIPRLTLELSDFRVAIRQQGKIDSVSLSQAAAIFLYEAQRRIGN